MKFCRMIIMLFFVVSDNALAQKTIKTIDVINVSDLSLTITYNLCHNERTLQRKYYDSINNITQYVYGENEQTCIEKTNNLSGKNTGKNIVKINANDQVKAANIGEKSIDNAEVYVFKITSQLGEQNFIASESDAKKTREDETNGALSRCLGANSSNAGGGNVIELDNKGTTRIYCHSSYQPN
jgi:hypothetical protein